MLEPVRMEQGSLQQQKQQEQEQEWLEESSFALTLRDNSFIVITSYFMIASTVLVQHH